MERGALGLRGVWGCVVLRGWSGVVAWRVALGLIKSLLWLPFGQEYSGIVTGLAAVPCGLGARLGASRVA